MALSLLWLGLTLLGALQTQAQGTIPSWIPAPPLSKVPLQPNFQADQVSGPEGPRRGEGARQEERGKGLSNKPAGPDSPRLQLNLPWGPLMEPRPQRRTPTLSPGHTPSQVYLP